VSPPAAPGASAAAAAPRLLRAAGASAGPLAGGRPPSGDPGHRMASTALAAAPSPAAVAARHQRERPGG